MRMHYGYYVGDNTDNRQIDIPFQPEMGFLRYAPASRMFCKVAPQTGHEGGIVGDSGQGIRPVVMAFGSLKLIVNYQSGGGFNTVGVTYHYTLLGQDTTVLRTGIYTGNGSSPRNIPCGAAGWYPDVVYVYHDDTNYRPMLMTSTRSTSSAGEMAGYGTYWQSNYFAGRYADGFIVGPNLNVSGKRYVWWALQRKTNNFYNGMYTGNGQNDRDIVIPDPFQPILLMMIGRGPADGALMSSYYRDLGHVGDIANAHGGAGNPASDTIQMWNSNGFEVGSYVAVNYSGYEFHYLAFKDLDLTEYFPAIVPAKARGIKEISSVIAARARGDRRFDAVLAGEAIPVGWVGSARSFPARARGQRVFDAVIAARAKDTIGAVSSSVSVAAQARKLVYFDAQIAAQARIPLTWTKETELGDTWSKDSPGTDDWTKESPLTDSWGKG